MAIWKTSCLNGFAIHENGLAVPGQIGNEIALKMEINFK